jgi:hypothetical protein
LAQQLVEFCIEDAAARFFRSKLFAKDFVAPPFLSLEFGDGSGQILDGSRFLRNFVGDYRTGDGIDSKGGLAAGALDIEQAVGHETILAHMATPGSQVRWDSSRCPLAQTSNKPSRLLASAFPVSRPRSTPLARLKRSS